jgi:subtilase family serine protease
MRFFPSLAALVLLSPAAALSSEGVAPKSKPSLVVFDSVYGIPQGWRKLNKPKPTTRLRFRIALEMSNHELFEQTLYDISTPDHESYGQHLSHDKVRSLVKPRDEASVAVLSWLENSGLPNVDIKHDNDWITFYTSLAKVEEMMDTEFLLLYTRRRQIPKQENSDAELFCAISHLASHLDDPTNY